MVLSLCWRVLREDMKLECHLDTDEGNSFAVKNGDSVEILEIVGDLDSTPSTPPTAS